MRDEWLGGGFGPTHYWFGGAMLPAADETRPPRFQPSLRLGPAASALLVLVLLAVVAAATRVRSGQATPAAAAAARIASAGAPAVAGLAALAVLVVTAVWVRRRWLGRERARKLAPDWWGGRFTAAMAAAIVIALVVPLLFTSLGRPRGNGGYSLQPCGEPWAPNRPCIRGMMPGQRGPQISRTRKVHVRGSGVSPEVVAGSTLAVLLLVAAVYFAQRRRRRGRDVAIAAPEPPAPPPLDLFEDIRAEPDPRRAVVAAYARMESILARRDLPRREFEAPHEYLRRVEPQAAPARPLTALFERAKFSPHAVEPPMKEQALGALVALRDGPRT